MAEEKWRSSQAQSLYRHDIGFKKPKPEEICKEAGKQKDVGRDVGCAQANRRVVSYKCLVPRPSRRRQVATKERLELSKSQDVTIKRFLNEW